MADISGFKREAFLKRLAKHYDERALCRFVALPDVVGSARRTLEAFAHWKSELSGGWRVALVAQDGQENLPIPWHDLDAIFIGGTTEWKLSVHARQIVHAAKVMNKWVHAGRVNTPARFEYFEALGADSIDGTGLSQYTWMRERIWRVQHAPSLFNGKGQLESIDGV